MNILHQNPLRRDEIRETRKSKLERLEEFIKEKTDYYNTHYRAKSTTLQKHIDKKISDLKLNKFVTLTITYKEGDIKILDKEKKRSYKN